MEIKVFVRSVAAYQVPEDVTLLKQLKPYLVHHLVNVRIIHYTSVSLLLILIPLSYPNLFL